VITGATRIIAHVGHPTATFKAPLIYNPWFREAGVDAAVVPMGVRAEDRDQAFRAIFRFTNVIGALVTMPHKVTVLPLLDRVSTTARVAGSANAVRIAPDGTLEGDMFDGEGFVRALAAKGHVVRGASALVVGTGGVGSAIAASLAGGGVARLALTDANRASAEALAGRLAEAYPTLPIAIDPDPAGHAIVANGTPLGMEDGDPLPFDVARLAPGALVGEVVLKREITPLLAAALAHGHPVQTGLDMLFAMIPAYLAFFGLPVATPERLRALSGL
jgi:shikimate dehydrogenase